MCAEGVWASGLLHDNPILRDEVKVVVEEAEAEEEVNLMTKMKMIAMMTTMFLSQQQTGQACWQEEQQEHEKELEVIVSCCTSIRPVFGLSSSSNRPRGTKTKRHPM